MGGAIPREYIPAVQKGVQEAMEKGVLAGYPMVDIKVTLFDGSYHEVDSSEMAFKIAGSMGFKEGAREANPILLEPMMSIEIITPEEFMGQVMSDLNCRRGKTTGWNTERGRMSSPEKFPWPICLDMRPTFGPSPREGRPSPCNSPVTVRCLASVSEEILSELKRVA